MLVSILLFSKIIFSIENNGLIFEISNTARVNSTFITRTQIGVGSSDNILKVYNVEGKLSFKGPAKKTIDLSHIESGFYFVKIRSKTNESLNKWNRKIRKSWW